MIVVSATLRSEFIRLGGMTTHIALESNIDFVGIRIHATDNDVSSANELVRTVLENEMRAEDQDHSHWMYRLEEDQPTKRQIKEVVETEEGLVERLISLNGRPLSAAQQ